MEDHGVPFKTRWRLTGERVKELKRLDELAAVAAQAG